MPHIQCRKVEYIDFSIYLACPDGSCSKLICQLFDILECRYSVQTGLPPLSSWHGSQVLRPNDRLVDIC